MAVLWLSLSASELGRKKKDAITIRIHVIFIIRPCGRLKQL